MTEEPEDRHPSDAEAERLLAQFGKVLSFLAPLLDLPPSTSRDRDVQWARDELARLQEALKALSYADPDAQPITHTPRVPRLPLLPGPPSWRTSLVSHHGVEAEKRLRAEAKMRRFPEDEALARAIEKALSDLTANPRAEPPRVVAMQVLDHHVARGERLPSLALELLARAMRIDPRSVVAAQRREKIAAAGVAGIGTKEIATELGVDPRTVRARRNDQTPEDAALLAAVAEGKDLRALRPAVAAALGLLDEDGRWRPQVIRELTSLPERVETTLVGAVVDGRFYGPRDARPDSAVDVEPVWQDRTIPSSGGILEPDLVREAARIEAQRRRDGEEPNVAKRIARAARIDIRRVRRLIARPDWEMAVTVEAVRLRGNEMLRRREGEVIAYKRGEGLVQMADPRAGKRNPSADQ